MEHQAVKAHVTQPGFDGHRLVAHVPDLARSLVLVHGPGFVHVSPADADPVQTADYLTGDFNHLVARSLKFVIGRVTGLALDVSTVGGTQQGNQASGFRILTNPYS